VLENCKKKIGKIVFNEKKIWLSKKNLVVATKTTNNSSLNYLFTYHFDSRSIAPLYVPCGANPVFLYEYLEPLPHA